MNPIYEKLFSTYGWSVLDDLDRGYDEEDILSHLDALPLDKKSRLRLEELFFAYHHRWSVDAFTLGLHQGLSLLHDDVRRPRPQQVQ